MRSRCNIPVYKTSFYFLRYLDEVRPIQYARLNLNGQPRYQVVVIITDGVPTDEPCNIADRWKSETSEFVVIIVAVGLDAANIDQNLYQKEHIF